jgi:hypothetical protein
MWGQVLKKAFPETAINVGKIAIKLHKIIHFLQFNVSGLAAQYF